MKSRAHEVPLSGRATMILEGLTAGLPGGYDASLEFIFPGQKRGKPLSGMAMSMVMKRMGVSCTVHGTVRSSFRDWCGDRTSFPRDIVELCLGHSVGSQVEQAYRRSSALERRREIMEAWAAFLESKKHGNAVPFTA